MTLRVSTLAGAAALVMLGLAPGAYAKDPAPVSITLAGLRTIQFLPVQYAQQQGYFKRVGLNVTILMLNSGPAVISGVVSGSAEVGYASSVPIIFARAQHQPVRIFDAMTIENSSGAVKWNWLVASKRSGIRSIKDLGGKTIAMNTTGGACELQFRDHMAAAGVPFDSVKSIVVPFPQMQAALQLGNADAACPVEPFYTSMRTSPEVQALALSSNTLAAPSQLYAEDVLFVRGDWGKAHLDALHRMNQALGVVFAKLKKDPTLYHRLLIEDYKFKEAMVNQMTINVDFANVSPTPADVEPLIKALKRNKMLTLDVKPEDVVLKVP